MAPTASSSSAANDFPPMDLETATIEDLCNELIARCPAAVIALCVPQESDIAGKHGGECETVVYHDGNMATRLGLAHMAVDAVMHKMNEDDDG